MTAEQIKQLRGLIINGLHIADRNKLTKGRACIDTRSLPKIQGYCRWCETPTASKRHVWHEGCLRQYTAAQGIQITPNGLDVVPYNPKCLLCDNRATEVDHRVALMVARQFGWRAFVKAHALANIRWLCGACHKHKTKADYVALADAKDIRQAKPTRQIVLDI